MNRRIADHRRVVGAVDGEADLLGRAVKRRHREGVDLHIIDAKELNRAVGDRIGVAPVGLQRQAAEIALRSRHAGLERGLVLIRIRDRERAARRQVAVDDIGVLGHIVNRRIADHRRIVCPVDSDRHRLGRAGTGNVADRHVVGDSEGFTAGEEIEGAVGRAERDGDRTRAGTRAVRRRGRQRTRQRCGYPARQRGAARPGGRSHARAHRVVVSEVDVGENECSGRVEALGDRVWTRGIRCQNWRVVGADDGNRHRPGQADPLIVGDGHVVDDGERLVGSEEIEVAVGSAERGGDRPRDRIGALRRD